MNIFAKSALALAIVGTVAAGATTSSEARNFRGAGVGIGLAAGALIGAAAANNAYYDGGYRRGYVYDEPGYAYEAAPAYESYAYDAPAYEAVPQYSGRCWVPMRDNDGSGNDDALGRGHYGSCGESHARPVR